MDRFSILSRLQDNWPGKFHMSRLQFIEKELRTFSNEAMVDGITIALRTAEFPPTVAFLYASCSKAKQHLARKADAASPGYCPGDIIDGQQTFTPQEALIELQRMREEYPDAFVFVPDHPKAGKTPKAVEKYGLEMAITRIYIKALKKCIALGPPDLAEEGGLEHLIQDDLF